MNASPAVPSSLRSSALALCLALLLSSPGFCIAHYPRLKMTIAPVKDTLIVGEPVLIKCDLTNVSDQEAGFLPTLASEFDFIGFRVKRPDGTTFHYSPGVCVELEPRARVNPVVIPPGGICTYLANPVAGVTSGAGIGWTLPEPGTYEITGTYSNRCVFTRTTVWAGDLTSNTISVKVSAPAGEDASAFSSVWNTDEVKRFFAYGCTRTTKSLKTVLRGHPNSAYAVYAGYYLASSYETTNPHRFADAVSQYRLVLQRIPETHPLHSLAQFHLGRCLMSTHKEREGVEMLECFLATQICLSRETEEAKRLIAANGQTTDHRPSTISHPLPRVRSSPHQAADGWTEPHRARAA